MTAAFPQAQLRPRQRRFWGYIWMVPVLALLLASWLMVDAWQQRGVEITLQFQDGHGLKPGDALRYRGIAIGQVERVALAADLGSIAVTVRLAADAVDVARAGSRFWIVRPQLDLSGVRGLDTVVGAQYLRVLPGSGEPQRAFAGIEQPPPGEVMEPGGLEIVLTTPGKGNLRPGAPISYRQVIIGTVLTVDLARDAGAVEAHAYIKPDYVNLIRANVKFWRTGGAQVRAGLGGLSVDVESVYSLVLGGINLAIPPTPGKRAAAGASFTLYDQPEDDWLTWLPGLSLYDEQESTARARPQLVSARLRWQYRNWLYVKRTAERHAWLLPVEGGLLGPADVLLPPDAALAQSAHLVLSEQPYTPAQPAQTYHGELALLPLEHRYPVWPSSQQRAFSAPENSLVVAGGDLPARFVGAERYRKVGEEWFIDPALPFEASWHGAAVVAESDGALLGILLIQGETLKLASFPTPDRSDAGKAP